MKQDKKIETIGIDGVYVFSNKNVSDKRGENLKIFDKNLLAAYELNFEISETIVICSKKNVLRGMHFQNNKPRKKLISVYSGKIYMVVIDLRENSPTYKKWGGIELCRDKTMYIPRKVATGFLALESSDVVCQYDGEYYPEFETGIKYDDDDICIRWPIAHSQIICSKRDLELQSFEHYCQERKL